MALGEYWGRNAKRKLQVKKLRFSPVSDMTRPSLLKVAPQASQRKWCFRLVSVATHLRDQGSCHKHRGGRGIFR
ncbi:hypothetical protein ACOSQ2_016659 [Xanthoceras sorbifolium]